MEVVYPCGKETIGRVLPHRDPFIWVSRVLSCEPGKRVVAELDVDSDLPLFAGHFPAHPVLPGVLLMEALAQAASFCLLVGSGAEGRIGFLAGIDHARFRHQVLPGDTVRLEAEIVRSSQRLCVAEVEATIDGVVCAEATQRYVLARQIGSGGAS